MSLKWEESHIISLGHTDPARLRYFCQALYITFSISCDIGGEWYLHCGPLKFEWWRLGYPYKVDGSNVEEIKHIALRLVFSRIGTIHELLDMELERLRNDS
jgi:hypothetical protein|tara:strand:- start:773 stop:1075 length:303 start_codon:yes stop_codon:yes gene_type:complete